MATESNIMRWMCFGLAPSVILLAACPGNNVGSGNQNNQNNQAGDCGNSVIDVDEQCDGSALDETDCLWLGYVGGDLLCGGDCRFDDSGCEPPPGCGDGVLDPGEECDGENLGGATCENVGLEGGELTCSGACLLDAAACDTQPVCGDGQTHPGERCDDGNATDCDGCTSTCRIEACGNDILDCGEECDDGNVMAGDGCSADCVLEACGNGVVDPGEVCDDGNVAAGDGCSPTCFLESCGDGTVDFGEQCDDGNLTAGDGCGPGCLFEECGNGFGDPTEECDDGNADSCDGCRVDCTIGGCGDWIVECGEVCDDGNTVGGDGCSANCASTESCGNGTVDSAAGEVCDDSNTVGGDGCSANCRSDETCPNGVHDPLAGESCDDGNTTEWDGCSSACECVEFQVNTYSTNNQYGTRVARAADGSFVVVYLSDGLDGSGRGIYLQRFDATGNPIGAELQVNTYTALDQTGPWIAMAPDGRFVVTWLSDEQDGSGYGIYFQRYSSAGIPQGTETQVNTTTSGSQNGVSVEMADDGSFVVLFQSDPTDYDILTRRYDANGVALTAETTVNSYLTGHQSMAKIGMTPTGTYAIVWHSNLQDGDGYGIFGQRFGSTGVQVGSEFPVNTTTAGDQRRPDVAMADDGSFMVIWVDDSQSTGIWNVHGRRYGSTGTALGVSFQINTFTTTIDTYPFIDMLGDGRGVVTWPSPDTDGDANGAYARFYNSNGVALGPEFGLNVYTAGGQSWPFAALNADGGAWIVWHSENQDGNLLGVFGRRFASTGQGLCRGF
jgi:cysteine-rich repeat protein